MLVLLLLPLPSLMLQTKDVYKHTSCYMNAFINIFGMSKVVAGFEDVLEQGSYSNDEKILGA